MKYIWKFLYEMFLGKRTTLRQAWQYHRKVLILLIFTIASVFMNVKQFNQTKVWRSAAKERKVLYQSCKSDKQKLSMQLDSTMALLERMDMATVIDRKLNSVDSSYHSRASHNIPKDTHITIESTIADRLAKEQSQTPEATPVKQQLNTTKPKLRKPLPQPKPKTHTVKDQQNKVSKPKVTQKHIPKKHHPKPSQVEKAKPTKEEYNSKDHILDSLGD